MFRSKISKLRVQKYSFPSCC